LPGDFLVYNTYAMPHTVYILKCSDNSLYTGCTNKLAERVEEHNSSKKGAKYTKARRPVVLVHTEEYKTLAEGRAREAEIKRLGRGEKLKLIRDIDN